MTNLDDDAESVQIPIAAVTAAARALARAGRSALAVEILDATVASSASARTQLALASAEVLLAGDWFAGTDHAAPRLQVATATLSALDPPDRAAEWSLAFLELRRDYAQELIRPDGTMRFGPDGRDLAKVATLRRRAEHALSSASNDRRRGEAEMLLGLIVDNIFGEREVAPSHYESALRYGEGSGDDMITWEALRHLGDHDHDDGDAVSAADRWARSTAVAARAGAVHGTLAQQLLLAVLARDAGDERGAIALAREVSRWAAAIGAVRLSARADAFVAGHDPTAPPEPEPKDPTSAGS